uniref:RRM domain-containing protein n=1 Tax=Leersia perrieri TaxID=77586 RepID=A0A0D9Y0R7_9ORYZ
MGMTANSPATRRARARRPFAVVTTTPPETARNRENVDDEAVSFSQCLRRFGKLAGGGDGKPAKKCPLSSSSSASRRRRRISKKFLTPAAAPYDAPRAPLSSPFDEVEESGERRRGVVVVGGGGGGEGSESRKKRTAAARRSVALREAMATLPEHGDGRVRYLVDTFERLLSMASDPGATTTTARRRRKKMTSWPPPSPAAARQVEIDVSYPSIASSSSEVSFPIINGVRLRRSDARESPRRQKRCSSICSSERSWSRKKIGVTIQRPFNLRTEKRGKMKEESLVQRMKNKLLEEERLRNPFAQGLPWTTDVPEVGETSSNSPPATRPAVAASDLEKRAASHGEYDEQDRGAKGTEVFVGGLARSVTERALREVFSPCGEIVDLRIMKDQNGISKLQGKRLAVDLSLDQDTLFFGNLCKDWSLEEFEQLVRKTLQDVVSVDLAMARNHDSTMAKRRLNRGFAFVRFSSHAKPLNRTGVKHSQQLMAAARILRIGSRTDFLLGGLRPSINWAEKESHVDDDEMAKVKTAFVGNLPVNVTEEYLTRLFEHYGEVVRVAVSRKGQYPVGFVHFATRTVSVARPVVENDKKRTREEVNTRRSNVSRDKPDHSYGRRGHDSYDRQAKAPRVSDIDPYEAAVVSLPSAVKELLLRILRLRIGTRYDIDIHCIKSLNGLPEKAAVAVLNQFLISGADKHNKGDYFTSLIAKYEAETFGSAPTLQGFSAYFPRNLEIPSKRFRHQDYEYTASSSSRYSSLGDYPSSSYVDNPASSQSRNRRLAHEPRQDTGRHLDLGYIQERSSNIERSAQVAISSREGGYLSGSRYNTDIGPELSPRSSAEYSTSRQQARFDPFTGEPYKFDPYTGEPIRP